MTAHFDSYKELQAAMDAGTFLFKPEYAPATFTCANCGNACPFKFDGGGTGYALGSIGQFFCYPCAGLMDAFAMGWTGKATLYLSLFLPRKPRPGDTFSFHYASGSDHSTNGSHVGNWPGTWRRDIRYVKVGRHNMAGIRFDVEFTGPDGATWSGTTYGSNTQICHAKRRRAD